MHRRQMTALTLSLLVCGSLRAAAPARKSPHVEIVGEATVVSVPRETKHRNGRKFLEFEIRLISARPSASQPAGADRTLAIDTAHDVRVVHDLSCGGASLH